MARSSASKLHTYTQQMCEMVIENEVVKGWNVKIKKEWGWNEYKVDVYVEFSNPYKHQLHETLIEIQKSRTEKSFVKKSKELNERSKLVKTFHYVVIWEDDITGVFNDDYKFLNDAIYMQGGYPF